jgi:hypothetical protein
MNTHSIQTTNHQLDPFYVTGLIQADGSFSVTLRRNPKAKYGIIFKPTLTLTLMLSPTNFNLLNNINSFFNNCGSLVTNTSKNALE